MANYKFFGSDTPDVKPVIPILDKIKNQRQMYDVLNELWSVETCAPRLRDKWSVTNKTCGQCSITSFLVQDIFGGDVYGIPLPDGAFHCYNVIGNVVFDLTSEQFQGEKLCYEGNPLQSREIHFAKEEKRLRYELLKRKLVEKLATM